MEIEPFIHDLPKVELHVHLEGTLTPELRWALATKNGVALKYSTFEQLKQSYGTWNDAARQNRLGAAGLALFLEQYFGGFEVLLTEDDFYELAMAYFRKAAAMNVRHAEVFFDPQGHTRRGVPVDVLMNGLQRAKRDAEEQCGLTCTFVLCFLRDMSPQSAEEAYEACLPYRDAVFSGIGLDGNERGRTPSLFDDIYRRARKDGLKVTAHCDFGQPNTHEHIQQCISTMAGSGLDRIDHGLSAADKPHLVTALVQRGIGLTLCPHAYRRRWEEADVFPPIRRLFDAGVKISIHSDDPTYMHNMYIAENMQLVRAKCQFTDVEVARLVGYAIEMSWATPARKRELGEQLAAVMTRYGKES